MKKFLYLLTLVFLSLSFHACTEDPIEDIKPSFDLPNAEYTDDEEEGANSDPTNTSSANNNQGGAANNSGG